MTPSATVKNEAAETLRFNFRSVNNAPFGRYHGDSGYQTFRHDLDEALATERRATVERIRERFMSYEDAAAARKGSDPTADDEVDFLLAILDEEAAR